MLEVDQSPIGKTSRSTPATYIKVFDDIRAVFANLPAARMRGYTETLFGRRRPIPELSNSNFRIRQAGERQAMNAGIQGLAAVFIERIEGSYTGVMGLPLFETAHLLSQAGMRVL